MKIRDFVNTSLYHNAGYLLVGNAVMALSSFLFWIVVARFYSVQDVGYSAAILAAIELAATISIMGTDYSIIRFLPKSNDKIVMVNAYILFISIFSFCIAMISLFGIEFLFPVIDFVKDSIIFSIFFIILAMLLAANMFISSVFVAQLKSKLVLLQNIISSGLKVILAIIFASIFASFGIISAVTIATGISTFICIFIFFPKILARYRIFPVIDWHLLNKVWKYSLGNYLITVVYSIQILLLPLLVIKLLGPEQNAYFYIVWGIISALVTASGAISISLFAEGVHSQLDLFMNIRKSIKFSLYISIMMIIMLIIAGKFILSMFGQVYSANGFLLLMILSPSIILTGISKIYASILRIHDNIRELTMIWILSAIIVLIASYYMLSIFGIIGVGYAWTVTQLFVFIYTVIRMKQLFRKNSSLVSETI